MIKLSNGHELEYVVASGALNFDGRGWWFEAPWRWLGRINQNLFTIVAKTVTYEPITGNLNWSKRFGNCVRLIDSDGNPLNEWHYFFNPKKIAGTVNAVGLTNKGYEWWCNQWTTKYSQYGFNMLASIMAKDAHEAMEMARRITKLNGIVGIEVNLSCPNTRESEAISKNAVLSGQIVSTVKENAGRLPVIVKLGPQQDIRLITELVKPFAEAVSFNSIPWEMLFPGKPSPLEFLGVKGGVSGKVAQPLLWDAVQALTKYGKVPVIGPSVWDRGDINTLHGIGAKAVHFGAVHLRGLHGATLPTRYVRQQQIILML